MKINSFFVLLFLCYVTSCHKATAPPPPHLVSTTKPLVKDVPVYVDYIGHVVAKTSVQVKSQVSGNLIAQYFEEGSEVKQGDLLLVIDPRPYEAALAKAEGALASSLASLKYAKETTNRYGPLLKQDFISQLNYDQYVTNMLVDEATVSQNRADLENSQINLGYCYMTAPMNCVTGKLQVKPGNYIDSNGDTELVLLNQIQPILVDFDVPETDLLTIQEKQSKNTLQLIVYPDAAHKMAFSGDLTLIDNQVNTGTGTVLMEGTFANEKKLLWPGHFVDVRLILEEQKGALLLPTEAVMISQKGHYIYVVKSDNTIEMRNVKIGQRYDDSYISILSGLQADEEVVTQGQLDMYPGMHVQIKNNREEAP